MKRILVLASSAALVLSGCNKVDRLADGSSTVASNVSFETYLGGKTKGLEKTTFKMGDQFFTYGVKTDADFNVSSPAFTSYVFVGSAPLDHGVIVSHLGMEGAAAIWNYDEVAPWDDKKATFFAVSPVPQGAQTYGITLKPIANNTIPSIDFSVVGGYDGATATQADILVASEKIKEQPDLVWAYSPDNIKTAGVIGMEFKHALSQLSFAVKAYHTAGLLRVNSITLKKVMTKGTLSLAHNEAKKGSVDYLGGWNAATTPLDFAVNLLTEKVTAIDPFVPAAGVTEPVKINITDNDEALMMIPQVLTGLGLEVRYSYSLDGVEWTNYESGTALDYELSKLSTHWNPNMRYNYCLNINPGKAITFNASIDAWDPINNTVDMEYRTFDAKATPGNLTKADGTNELFKLNKDDKISVAYAYDPAVVAGQEWMSYTTGVAGALATPISAAKSVTVTDADAGNWTFNVDKNFYPNVRKAVITIQRAPFKKMVNGKEVLFSAGVSKYVVTQVAGKTLSATSMLYGTQNAAVITGLNGYTTKSYPNAQGATAYATEALLLAAEGERPYLRFRVAKSNATSTYVTVAAAITACSTYSEVGMPAGKWRLPRAAECKLIGLNKTVLDPLLTDKLTTTAWSATLNGATNNWRLDSAGGLSSATATSAGGYARCVAEE